MHEKNKARREAHSGEMILNRRIIDYATSQMSLRVCGGVFRDDEIVHMGKGFDGRTGSYVRNKDHLPNDREPKWTVSCHARCITVYTFAFSYPSPTMYLGCLQLLS